MQTQAINTVNVNNTVVNIKRGPFGNTFVQHKAATIIKEGRVTRIKFYALCTADSYEAGRIYCCYATLKGTLTDYYTVN